MILVDSHCHLDDPRFDEDREAVVERAREAGVARILAIGTGDGPPDLEAGIRLAERFDGVYATAGVHPHDASKTTPETMRALESLLMHAKVLALGEIGLDYHYDFSPRDRQRQVFLDQLLLARQARKPVIIHTREAWEDTLAMLRNHWAPSGLGGIMHCFSGSARQARQALELGFHISFAGVVTFRKVLGIQAAARAVPPDRLLVETDAPYLAPVPQRGKRNEPAFLAHTARRLAELRGDALEDLAAATTGNFQRLLAPDGGARPT